MALSFTREESNKLYNHLKEVKLKDIFSIDWKKITSDVSASKTYTRTKVPSEYSIRSFYKVAKKIADQTSENDFYRFMQTGEIPPIKLTAEEMEMAKGGLTLLTAGVFLLCAAAGVAVAGIGYAISH